MLNVSNTNPKYDYSERVDKAVDVISALGLIDDEAEGELLIQVLLAQMDLPTHPDLNTLADLAP